jgi:hypothetical protein
MLRVLQKGARDVQYNEADAAEAITPGHLVKLNASAKAIKNTVAGVAAAQGFAVMVACENDNFGGGIDDAYAVDDRVLYAHLKSGDEFYGLVPAAAAAIAFDAYVTSDGAGGIIVGTAANAIGRARTAVDNSGGGSPARLLVVVL